MAHPPRVSPKGGPPPPKSFPHAPGVQEVLRLLLEKAPVVVFRLDPEGRVVFFEGRGLAGARFAPAEAVGRRVAELFPDHAELEEHEARGRAGERVSATVEVGGRWWDLHYEPLRDAAGAFQGTAGFAFEATDRVRAERRARRAEDAQWEAWRLRQMDQLRAEFCSMAAHEIQSPIVPLRVQVSLLRSGTLGALDPRQERALAIADRSLTRLQLLAEDLLDVTRLHGGRFTLALARTDLDAVAADLVETFAEQADRAGIRLVSDLQAGTVVCDERRIMQVLANLLSNALKFTPRGGGVRLQARATAQGTEFLVADTGVGVAEEDLPLLFRPFSQLGEAGGKVRGTGLGLYICKSIVEQHGGRIWAVSPGPGQGTTFHVELPREPRGVRAAEPVPPETRRA